MPFFKDDNPFLARQDSDKAPLFKLQEFFSIFEGILLQVRKENARNLYTFAPKTGSEKEDELTDLVEASMRWLFRKQRDDKWLQPMRSVFNNASYSFECRGSIIAILSETDSKQNIPFFQDILRAHRIEEELSGAVYGLANSGDDSSINDLEMMAGYLFDKDIKRGHLAFYILAVRGLESLAARGNEAATAILQKSAAKLCQCRPSDYSYMDNNSSFLFESFGRLGGAGNIHFLEQLQEKPCINQQAKRLAQQTLLTIQ